MGAGPRQGELFPKRTPILFREVTQKRGWAFSAGWMTSKDGGWGWRLVTGATQGGPTCPTRSGLALHPALCSEHHGTGLTAAPPTRDSSGPQEKDLRHRIRDSTHTEGLAAHPIHSPTLVLVPTHTHPPTRTPTALPGQVGAQEGSRASAGYTWLRPQVFPADYLLFLLEFLGN